MRVAADTPMCFAGGKFCQPGFRFHPTDEELMLYYLKRKIFRRPLIIDVIGETDVYKWDPEELPEQSNFKSGDRQWFFFSPRDRRYPNGARSSRATMHGYWKATGKDRIITYKSRTVGIKKTLVFYKGRAPTGQRTDWVMHEYTLDEAELKSCQAGYDYFALYKLYKKSGPGPKNGEQYGAPFKEEEWADDNCLDPSNLLEENFVKEQNVGDIRASSLEGPLNDIEELLNKIADDSVPFPPIVSESNPIVTEEEKPSGSFEQYAGKSLDFAHMTASQLQPLDNSELVYFPKAMAEENKSQAGGEGFSEDFLEMDDLICPEPPVPNLPPAVDSVQFDEFDGLGEFDFYQDPSVLIHEIGPLDNNNYNVESGLENPDLVSYLSNNVDPLQPESNNANQVSCELWAQDQSWVSAPLEANNWEIDPPLSGNVSNGNPTEPMNQFLISKEDNGTDSWFSSALWTFVESVPTTPASASESSALLNRAFERMSSFGGAKINLQSSIEVANTNRSVSSSRSGRSSRGILYFSFLGVLCAILWVFVVTSFDAWGTSILLQACNS